MKRFISALVLFSRVNHVHSSNWIDLPQLELSNAEFKQQGELCSFTFGGKEWCMDVKSVQSLELIGLKSIKRMIIGDGTFTNYKEGFGCDSKHHFCVKGSGSASDVVRDGLRSELKDNNATRELRIGRYSFSDYASCEIENCAFTSIAIGNLTEQSYNFYYATLQLSRTQSTAL